MSDREDQLAFELTVLRDALDGIQEIVNDAGQRQVMSASLL